MKEEKDGGRKNEKGRRLFVDVSFRFDRADLLGRCSLSCGGCCPLRKVKRDKER